MTKFKPNPKPAKTPKKGKKPLKRTAIKPGKGILNTPVKFPIVRTNLDWNKKNVEDLLKIFTEKQNKPLRRTKIKKRQGTPAQVKKASDTKRLHEIQEELWNRRHHYCEECLFELFIEENREEQWIMWLFLSEYGTAALGSRLLTGLYSSASVEHSGCDFHHPLEKGRRIFKHLKLEKINQRIKCRRHHSSTSNGKITRYEELMRKALLKHFIDLGKLPDLPYESFFKS